MGKKRIIPIKKTREVQLTEKVATLKAELKDSWLEWTRRGRELEKINKLVTGWRVQIPDVLYERLRAVLDGYIDRCTSTCEQSTKKRGGKRLQSKIVNRQ